MKILICGNGHLTQRGNAFLLHTEICRFLRECLDLGLELGYMSCVFAENEKKTLNIANAQIPEQIHVEKIPAFSQLPAWKKLLALPFIGLRLIRLVCKYDFFYCFYPGTATCLLIRTARFFRKKYALYVRGELRDTPATRRDIRKASFILATGTSIVRTICPDYGECRETAPMSAVFGKECAAAPRTDFHQPLRGLFVGRVEPPKGVYELLEAMKVLKGRGLPVTMNFVGSYTMDFAHKVQAMNVADCVILSGLTHSNEELEKHYEEADFFCLPTWTEGFPRVLYEAMSHALPCLNTMVGGIPSRMRDGENCLALKPRDAESIVSAITQLFDHPEQMRRLSAASLQTFRYWKEYFSGQTHAKQLCAAVAELDHKP